MTLPLQVGVQLPEVEWDPGWPDYVAMAHAAEEGGFASIWLGDHLLYRSRDQADCAPWEAWTMLAALATVTSRVRLGPLVACASFHPPGVIAKMAATIDEISGGRFVLGLGAGWNEPEYHAFDLPYDFRVSRFSDSFEIIRRLLAGERTTFQGRFWSANEAVLVPAPKRQVPLMVGTAGDRMLAITVPHVDCWNAWCSWFGNTVAGFVRLNARVTATAERVDRDPTEIRRSACVLVDVAPHGSDPRGAADDVPYVSLDGLRTHLDGLAEAGADEAILVLRPITEDSIRIVAQVLAA